MNKKAETFLKQMYLIETLSDIPQEVIFAVRDADELCKRAGGELASRQILATLVQLNDKDKIYLKIKYGSAESNSYNDK